jgi:hypothetical protein
MELETITMPKAEARKAFAAYRRDVRAKAQAKLGEATRLYRDVDAGVLAGYRALAQGRSLIKLGETIAHGGVERTVRPRRWGSGDIEVCLPRLAIVRATATRVITAGVQTDGTLRFYAGPLDRWNDPPSKAKANRVVLDTMPEEMRPAQRPESYHEAIVPTVPPSFRPSRGLGSYHILWEADWTREVPIDPALLKHLGGDLYAVVAVWDLTELERAVLGNQG